MPFINHSKKKGKNSRFGHSWIALIDSEYEPDEDENPTAVTPQIISSNSEPETEPERESSITPQAPITTIAESTESIVGSPSEEQSSKSIV